MTISLLLLIASACLAGEFIDALDVSWNDHDYDECGRIIRDELRNNPSNLTAQVAMAAYHGWIEFDIDAAISNMPQEVIEASSKSGKAAKDTIDIWRIALTIPMNTEPTEQQKELVRRELWPTNYPEREIYMLLEEENQANHGLESTSAPPAAGTLETHP